MNYETYTLYNKARLKYLFAVTDHEFLDIHYRDMSEQDIKVIYTVLEIDDALTDLNLTKDWFDNKVRKYPFEGRTPREYINEIGLRGLYETRLYINALRYHLLQTLEKYEESK